jgi:predicted MFS family arabinose efflux permease
MGVIMASFSVASIVGIPLSLLISYHAGWHISFFALALLSTLIGILGFWMIPPIKGHLNKETPHLKTAQLYQELLEILQQKKTILAFLFSVLLTFSGFLVIPMLNPYMVHNMKFPEHHLATSYFVAGLFTFITTLIIGKLSDRFGSARVFKCVAIGSILPVMLMTHLGPHSLGIVFAVSSLFMIFMSGRMIPGMTLITQVPSAKHRGSFMSLHACIQHLATAAASFICGLIVIQAPSGKILHFNWAGWLSVGCILLSLWVLNSLLPKKQSQIQ